MLFLLDAVLFEINRVYRLRRGVLDSKLLRGLEYAHALDVDLYYKLLPDFISA